MSASAVRRVWRLASARGICCGEIDVARASSHLRASTSDGEARGFSTRARVPPSFEPWSPVDLSADAPTRRDYLARIDEGHRQMTSHPTVKAVVAEEYEDVPERHVVEAVRRSPWKVLSLFLRYDDPDVFSSVFRGLQFREMARVGTAWARTSESLRHQEASLSHKLGMPVEIFPVKFEGLALSAQLLAQDIAINITQAAEDRASIRRLVETFRNDVLLPNRFIKGFRIRIKGKLTAGMASGFVVQGGSTHTTSFTSVYDVGVAHAQTRIGIIGVKVWLIYHQLPWSRAQHQMDFWAAQTRR